MERGNIHTPTEALMKLRCFWTLLVWPSEIINFDRKYTTQVCAIALVSFPSTPCFQQHEEALGRPRSGHWEGPVTGEGLGTGHRGKVWHWEVLGTGEGLGTGKD
ncbi:hypothetical protein EMCRGX_G004695 [Ephydatia muelleri]